MANIPGNAPVPVNLQQVLAQINALQGQLTTLQAENATLTTQIQGLQQAAVAPQGQAVAPPAGGGQAQAIAPVASFALTPAMTDVAGLIDYSSKLCQSIYKQGCKKLTSNKGFAMTPVTTVTFVKAFENRSSIMGWNQGPMNIMKFTNSKNAVINIVKSYGQINEATFKAGWDIFCDPVGANYQTRASQNNHMMAQCLKKSLTVAALARLEPYQSQYLFNGIKYGLMMYKIIMRLATINSVATDEAL
jgi:hypothetical protein